MIKARLFDKQRSGYEEAELEFHEQTLTLHTKVLTRDYALSEVNVSDRLGNMPRSLYLPDGKVCESQDNDAIDSALKQRKLLKTAGLIHHLESKSIYILPAIAVTVLLVFVFLKHILPYSAEKIAYAIPQNIASQIGTGTLKTLDKLLLKPSRLGSEKKEAITAAFNTMAVQLKALPPLDLQFRSAKDIGPNAFALPDGTIVMTDQLVMLSENNEELLSILAHEIGHIKNRHAIRMVLQKSAMLLVLTTLTGDATSASSIVSTLPTLLIENAFSRDLESEADDYAMDVMKKADIPLHYFADIMQRLSMGRAEDETGEYFSSHPITRSRIAKFRE
jgi:Zn-dependent protease with chaperone function